VSLFSLIRTVRRRLQYRAPSGYAPLSINDTFTAARSGSYTMHVPSKRIGWQLLFHPFLMCGCALRAIHFFVEPFLWSHSIQLEEWLQVILSTLPSFVFFSNFLIILFLWAEIYHYSHKEDSTGINRLKPIYVIITSLLYFIVTILYVINFTTTGNSTLYTSNNPTETTIVIFSAAVYLKTSLGFLLYGCKLYAKLRGKHSLHTQSRQNVLRRIKFITSVVTVCFLIRAVFVFTTVFIRIPLIDEWWFFSIYYVALELFPLVMMVRLLHGKKKAQTDNLHALPETNMKAAVGTI